MGLFFLFIIGLRILGSNIFAGIIAPEDVEPATVNIEKFGGRTSLTNNTPALEAAIAALPVKGGSVLIGAGQWRFEEEVKGLKEKTSITIIGVGGGSGSLVGGTSTEAATTLMCNITAAGIKRFIDMRKTFSCGFIELDILNNSKPLSETAGAFVVDWESAQEPKACNITTECGGVPTIFSTAGWNLNKSNSGVWINCAFKACKFSVRGTSEVTFSAAHKWFGGIHIGSKEKHIFNPGQQWTFYGTIFEPLGNEKGETTNEAGAFAIQENTGVKDLDLIGCWFGGIGETGVQIEWTGSGLRIHGGLIANANVGITLYGTYSGIEVDSCFEKCKNGINAATAITGPKAKLRIRWTECATTVLSPNNLGKFGAQVERAVATPLVASTESDTDVLLSIECQAATRTVLELFLAGVLVQTLNVSVTVAGLNFVDASFKVPLGQTWEVKVKEGKVEKMFSSYLVA
jgi:hypothetical protein